MFRKQHDAIDKDPYDYGQDIYGRSDSGVEDNDHLELKKASRASFERGSVDKFSYDIKDVGKPFKIRFVYHKG